MLGLVLGEGVVLGWVGSCRRASVVVRRGCLGLPSGWAKSSSPGEIRENQDAAVFRMLIHHVVRGIDAADSRPRDGDGINPAVPELCGGVRCQALFAVAHAAQQKEQMGNFRSR